MKRRLLTLALSALGATACGDDSGASKDAVETDQGNAGGAQTVDAGTGGEAAGGEHGDVRSASLLVFGAHDFALHLGPSGNRFWPPGRADELGRPADRGPGGQTGSGLIRATAAGSGQTPEENGVGAAANDAENGQTHAKWTVGEAHRRLPELYLRSPWHLL